MCVLLCHPMSSVIFLGTYILVAPLDDSGIKFPDKLMPDISTGRMFSKFLRNKGIVPDDFPTYEHEFVNQNRPAVYARLYPIKYLEEFRKYFYYTWMPTKSLEYFRQRRRKYYRLLSGYCRYRHPKRNRPKSNLCRRAADSDGVHLDGWLADADRHPLTVFAAGADTRVQ